MSKKRPWRKISNGNKSNYLIRRICLVMLVCEIAFGIQKLSTIPTYEVSEIIRINNE